MRVTLLSAPFLSIADLIRKTRSCEIVRRNVLYKLDFSQALGTLVGDESVTRAMQMRIVDALRRGERNNASNLLLGLGQGNFFLRADDFLHILSYCAKSPDPLFVMETWRLLKEKEIDLSNKGCWLMMQALCRGGYLEEAYKLMNYLGESRGIYLPACNMFLGACVKIQNIVHLNRCLDLMESQMVGKNETTYRVLLEFAVLQQNLDAAHAIWNEYIKHYSSSILILPKFIWSFSRLRDLKSAYEALQHMVHLVTNRSISVKKAADGMLRSSRLDIPIPSHTGADLRNLSLERKEDPATSVYFDNIDSQASITEKQTTDIKNRESNGVSTGTTEVSEISCAMEMLGRSFSDVIYGSAINRNCGLAEQLILQMENLGLQPSRHTYDGFVRAVVSGRGFRDGMKVLTIMKQKNLKPYDSTLATLSIGCSKALELDLAETLLDQIKRPCSRPFNALLEACDITDQPERAVRVLAKMRHLKLHPDIWTYEMLFSLFGNVNFPYEDGNMLSHVETSKRISAIEMDMSRNGVRHSNLSMTYLLKALGAEGMISELLHHLQEAERHFSYSNKVPDVSIYNTVLHSLVAAKETHMAATLFKNMKLCGSLADAATYHIMIDCCSILKCFRSACALFSMMVRDGFSPERKTYTTLIKVSLEGENFDEAFNLLGQACSEGIELDVVLFNTILKTAAEKGRIDVVELIIEWMRREQIQPDPTTCNYVFSTYVESGFYNTALEALQVLSMRMISEEDSTLEEMKKEFEADYIYSEDLDAESRIIQFFKDSDEYVATALLNLRWCAIAGLSISWSPNESVWVRRQMTSYDTRPRLA